MIKKTIKLKHLKAKVTVVVGDYDECRCHLDSDMFSDSGYLARTVFRRTGNKLCHECVIHSKSAAISVIAHEAVHAASFIFDAIGMAADFNNDEIVAYLVQLICEEMENALGLYN